ncbi:MAG: hypothetical protein GY950_09100 [bacterium]|nr:hypothetical protein [bacterium]
MAVKDLSIDARLYRAEIVVRNAWDHPVIREAVARYNYGDARMKEGLDLSEKAVRLNNHQKDAAAEKFKVTIVFHEKMGKLKGVYREHLQLTRMAFGGQPSFSQMLALSGPRKRRIAGWLADVRQFYTNALTEPKVVQAMAGFSVSRENLKAARKLLEEVDKAAADLEKKKGLAVKATGDRNMALKALERWVADFLRICRLAMGDSQHLEALGIVVPS